jgi:hypothetical protein
VSPLIPVTPRNETGIRGLTSPAPKAIS